MVSNLFVTLMSASFSCLKKIITKINNDEEMDWIMKYFINLSLLSLSGVFSFFGEVIMNETAFSSKSLHKMIQEFLLKNNRTEDASRKIASLVSVVIFSI
jgi:hypothetical protein